MPPTRATGREWAGLAVLALPTLLVSMDFTLLHLAVPRLSAELRPSSSQLLWITDIYGFLLAGFLIPMGALGDRIGLRRILTAGAAAFGVASALAAFAPTSGSLIVMRGVLGIAGATLVPPTLSLIRRMFHDDDQRRVAISVWMITFMIGSATGPLVGGVLLSYFWWGSVFLVGVPAMLVFLLLGRAILPEFADAERARPDLASVVFALASILTFIFGVKRLAQQGVDAITMLSLAAGLLCGALFVRRQQVLAVPVVDLALFRSRAFSLAFVIQLLTVFTFMGTFFFVAQYLQLVVGLTPSRLACGYFPQPWRASSAFSSRQSWPRARGRTI